MRDREKERDSHLKQFETFELARAGRRTRVRKDSLTNW